MSTCRREEEGGGTVGTMARTLCEKVAGYKEMSWGHSIESSMGLS